MAFINFKCKKNMPKKISKPVVKKAVEKVVAEVKKNPIKELEVQKSEGSKPSTKNSQLIQMIKSAKDGISLKKICENLKWQPHTARSAISRLNKNQNLGVLNHKSANGDRVYKLERQ